MLREARESLGLDLAQVAEDTRIRLPFLEAIEDGRFQDLPGSAYAPAFLRGYAGCVRLDVDRVMEVYRSGDKPAVPAPELHFPVVPIERRTPRGALLLASVALLIGAYVTWHALTRGQMTQEARVPPVPQRLLADQKPTSSGEPAAAQPPATQPPAAQPVAGAPQPASADVTASPLPPAPLPPAPPSATGGTSPVPVPQASPPTVASTTPAPASDPSANAGAGQQPRAGRDGRPTPPDVTRGIGGDVKPEPNPQVVGPPAPVSPPQAGRVPSSDPIPARKPTGGSVTAEDSDPTQPNRVTSRNTPPPRPPATPPSTAGADAAPPQQAAVPPDPPKPAAKPKTQSGPPSARARTVRAEVDSTLELRGPGGEVLATTYLRAGSTYTVPEHIGYALIPGQR